MTKVDSLIYLGDCMNSRGTIDETVKLRVQKAVGISSQITSILNNVSLGIYFFRTAFILRETMYINGIMMNSESWNFLSLKNIKSLEDSDARIFANIFCSPRSTNRVLFYLESAKIPVRYILSKRRLMYLWHILSRPPHELIRRVYEVQALKPVSHDWFHMISEERRKYDIDLTDKEIQSMSKTRFKSFINKKVDRFAFSKLISTARGQSKCKSVLQNINEEDIMIQKYLLSNQLVKEEQILLFSLRTYNFPVKSNFRYLFPSDLKCRACNVPDSEESETHLCQSCEVFKEEKDNRNLNFEDVFGPLKVQINFIKRFKIIARKWKLILEMEKSTILMDPAPDSAVRLI